MVEERTSYSCRDRLLCKSFIRYVRIYPEQPNLHQRHRFVRSYVVILVTTCCLILQDTLLSMDYVSVVKSPAGATVNVTSLYPNADKAERPLT